MVLNRTRSPLGFSTLWFLGFLAFPAGGVLAQWASGPVDDIGSAAVGGVLTGAVLGLTQWWVLTRWMPVSPLWVLGSAAGLALGLVVGTALLGTDTLGGALLWRGLIAGLSLGAAQALAVCRQAWFRWPQAALWVATVTLSWPLGWWITRSVGIDLSPHWTVFGSTGAWAFQGLTGVALLWLRTSLFSRPGAP